MSGAEAAGDVMVAPRFRYATPSAIVAMSYTPVAIIQGVADNAREAGAPATGAA